MSQVAYLFGDRRVASTAAVASFAGISLDRAREWGWALHVERIGRTFAWTRGDVEALLREFAPPAGAHELDASH